MNTTYIIYRLDVGGYVLVDDEGSSVHFETLELLYAEISRCEEPYIPRPQ